MSSRTSICPSAHQLSMHLSKELLYLYSVFQEEAVPDSVLGRVACQYWPRLRLNIKKGQVNSTSKRKQRCSLQAGQSVLISTTELKDARDWHHNEQRVIVATRKTTLGSAVTAIQLDSPLSFTHYGGREYQAEVSLLSRNFKVQGDEVSSEPTDTANAICKDPDTTSTYPCPDKYLTGFGGHIMMKGQGQGRFSCVELYRMGQANVLGRYPLHWHMLGNQTEGRAYAQDCSVHHSFLRAL
eukprot:g27531.t1